MVSSFYIHLHHLKKSEISSNFCEANFLLHFLCISFAISFESSEPSEPFTYYNHFISYMRYTIIPCITIINISLIPSSTINICKFFSFSLYFLGSSQPNYLKGYRAELFIFAHKTLSNCKYIHNSI